ncbi:Proteasome subunit alpha type-6 [Naganishia albida]|nr:Proteasome subunit alpha type-6 [Naganishia albida]
MTKRQAPPPPLPPGPQPQQQQDAAAAAIHAAAWQQYYASQGIISQPAQPAVAVQPASAPATTNAYQNYGYGPGAGMPGPGTTMGVGVGMNMAMPATGAAGNHMYGRPQQAPVMGAQGMGMQQQQQQQQQQPAYGMQAMGMQGVPMQGIAMQPQGYAGMYQQPAVQGMQPQQQAYGMQPMAYQQPQQQPMAMPAGAAVAGPVRPYGRPAQQQAPIQQPYAGPGPYSSIQPAGPMTPMNPTRPPFSGGGARGGRRPPPPPPSGGPGPNHAPAMNGNHPPTGNFPPAKRPRMEGPPPVRGPSLGPPAPPRSAPAAGMDTRDRRYPPSDYGGSQDGGRPPSSMMRDGPPRGSIRGRGVGGIGMSRGVPASRGRGGSFSAAAAATSESGSIRRSPRPIRASVHGPPPSVPSSYRGRGGAKFTPGPGSSSAHPGAPRAPRTGPRGSERGRGGYATRPGETYGHHRRYEPGGLAAGGPGSKIPHKAPSGPAGGSRRPSATPGRTPGGKSRAGADDEAGAAAYQEERTRVAREEARKRTMTDFRIVGLEIKQLGWKWGTVREIEVPAEEGDSGEGSADEGGEEESVDGKDQEEVEDVAGEAKTEDELPAKVEPVATTDSATNADVKVEPGVEQVTSEAPVKAEAVDAQDGIATSDSKDDAAESVTETSGVKAENGVVQEAAESTSEEVVRKRGEKRKAKMSSPDAEDDARIIAKKRNTHGPNNRTMETAAPAPEKNRFRIYFASPVEPGEGISLKAYFAGKVNSESHEDHVDEHEEDVQGQGEEQEVADALDAENVDEAAYIEEQPDGEEGEGIESVVQENLGDDAEGSGEAVPPGGEEEEHADETAPVQEDAAVETVEEDPEQEQAQHEEAGDAHVAPDEKRDEEELGDVSMITAEGGDKPSEQPEETTKVAKADLVPSADGAPEDAQGATLSTEEAAPQAESVEDVDGAVAKAQKVELKVSAENTSAAYGARSSRQPPVTPSGPLAHSLTDRPFRRSPSAPPTSCDVPVPTPNRLSILFADGTRRLVLDATVVESVQIHRRRGTIKVRIGGFKQAVHEKQVENLAKKTGEMNVAVSGAESTGDAAQVEPGSKASEGHEQQTAEEAGKPKSPVQGILFEALNEEVNVFGLGSSSTSAVPGDEAPFPRLDMLTTSETADEIELTAFLDTGNRLSEPKWVKSGHLEDWINSIKSRETASEAEENWRWRKKLEVVDPDVPTTLASVLEGWAYKSKLGSLKERRRFLSSHLLVGHEFAHILTRASHNEDYTPLSPSQFLHTHSILKRTVPPTSPHYGQQSFASLAVMALVNLAKEYSARAGENPTVYQDKVADIIKALPNPVIYMNTDKLFQDWQKQSTGGRRGRKPMK